jgi:hypothetical protein
VRDLLRTGDRQPLTGRIRALGMPLFEKVFVGLLRGGTLYFGNVSWRSIHPPLVFPQLGEIGSADGEVARQARGCRGIARVRGSLQGRAAFGQRHRVAQRPRGICRVQPGRYTGHVWRHRAVIRLRFCEQPGVDCFRRRRCPP